MRSVACYLCSSPQRKVLFPQRGHDPYLDMINPDLHAVTRNWAVCMRCGFVYRDPMPDSRELAALYAGYERDVFGGTDPDTYFDRIVALPREQSENYQKLDWLVKVLDTQGFCGRKVAILDVGCGGGTLLHTVSGMIDAKRLCGVELNQAYARLAARRVKAEVRCETYTSGRFGQTFELVICTKVLEHVPDPSLLLAEMAKDLSPGGLMFLEVPDIADVCSLPPEHERYFIPHLYYFSVQTLGALLGRIGLSIVEARSVTTARGRAYLQLAARFNNRNADMPRFPLYDPQRLLAATARFRETD